MAGPPRQGHIHSNYAKKIVHQLCIARFEGNGNEVEPTETAMCKQGEINEAREINEKTLTFVLETQSGEVMANNREYFPDLDSIGKHYLVSTTENPHIKRHYTTCCGMNPIIYDKLCDSLNERAKENTRSLEGS